EGEILLEFDVDSDPAFLLAGFEWNEFDDFAVEQGAKKLPAAAAEGGFDMLGFVAITNEFLHAGAAVIGAAEDIEQHSVRDLKTGDERFGSRIDETKEGFFVPADESFRRFFLNDFFALLFVPGGFAFETGILDNV